MAKYVAQFLAFIGRTKTEFLSDKNENRKISATNLNFRIFTSL